FKHRLENAALGVLNPGLAEKLLDPLARGRFKWRSDPAGTYEFSDALFQPCTSFDRHKLGHRLAGLRHDNFFPGPDTFEVLPDGFLRSELVIVVMPQSYRRIRHTGTGTCLMRTLGSR